MISMLNSALECSATGEVVVAASSWPMIASHCIGIQRGNDWKVEQVVLPPQLRRLPHFEIPIECERASRSIIPYFVQRTHINVELEWMSFVAHR